MLWLPVQPEYREHLVIRTVDNKAESGGENLERLSNFEDTKRFSVSVIVKDPIMAQLRHERLENSIVVDVSNPVLGGPMVLASQVSHY